MKLLFDFDEVLFNTRKFKERIYNAVENIGISREVEEQSYQEFRKYAFSLKKFLSHLFEKEKKIASINDMYEEIMADCPSLINKNVIEVVSNLGPENCIILTSGDEEFQMDKIKRSGVESLFSKIIVVPGSKRKEVSELCNRFKNEKVLFIDDKQKFFDDLEIEACPNLKTILFDDRGLEKLKAEIEKDLI